MVGDGFIGDANGAAVDQAPGLFRVGGEMEIGEENLPGPEHPALRRLRLFDPDDQLGLGEDFAGVPSDSGAGGQVVGVRTADAGGGTRLDDGLMAMDEGFMDAGRRHADPGIHGF